MTPGTVVRMNAACKRALFATDSHAHVKEFGRCYGYVEGLVDYGNQQGPELNVRWMPSKLRYAYAPEHLQTVVLKAFVVSGTYDPESEGSALVYAYNGSQARHLGHNDIGSGVEYVESRARRSVEHDARALTMKAPCVECDVHYLRDAGWHLEDEYSCGGCGLSAMGMEDFGVCRSCHLCKQCGCEEECDQSEGFSCE